MEDNNYNPDNRTHNNVKKGSGGKIVGVVTLVVVVAIAGFLGGMAYQKGHQKAASGNAFASGNNSQFPSGGFGGSGPGGGQMPGGFGTVTAVSDSSITVQNTRSGSSTTYSITSSTTVTNNGSTAAVSDIKAGDTVIVQTSSSDSTTATQIIDNPNINGGPPSSS